MAVRNIFRVADAALDATRGAGAMARSSGGRGFLKRRSTRLAMGAGAIGGAYAVGRSSGARSGSLVPPSRGIFRM